MFHFVSQQQKIFTCIDSDILSSHQARVQKVIRQLLEGQTKSASLDQLKPGLYKVRLNNKLRLFIALRPNSSGLCHLYLLHIMENHKYKLPLEVVRKLKQQLDTGDMAGFHPYEFGVDMSSTTADIDDADLDLLPCQIEGVRLLGRTLFQLTGEQQAPLQDAGSFILYGQPGAGKSSVSAFLIEQLIRILQPTEDGEKRTIVYAAQTPRLVTQMRQDVNNMLRASFTNAQREKVEVIFNTTQELYSQAGFDFDTFVGDEYFKEYMMFISKDINEYSQACKIPEDIRPGKKSLSNYVLNALYQELCLLAPWNAYPPSSDEEHVSEKNSYFKLKDFPGATKKIEALLKNYRQYLIDNKRYDPGISLSENGEKRYFYLILDEAQNITLNAVAYFAKQADNICLLTDDNQNTTAPKSSLLLKKNLLQIICNSNIPAYHRKAIPLYRLSRSFRCLPAIRRVAHSILEMRDRLAGISPEQTDISADGLQGKAEIFLVKNDEENREAIEKVLSKVSSYKKTEIAILCLESKELVSELFPGYLVFYPHEIPGNEFSAGVLYHPLKQKRENNPYVDINTQLPNKHKHDSVPHSVKHATQIIDTRFSRSLQELYMMLTRFIDDVTVIQYKKDWNTHILDEWKPYFTAHAALPVEQENLSVTDDQATESDWLERLLDLRSADAPDIEQIRRYVIQHLYQNLTEDQRYQAFEQAWRIHTSLDVAHHGEAVSTLSTSSANAVEQELVETNSKISSPEKIVNNPNSSASDITKEIAYILNNFKKNRASGKSRLLKLLEDERHYSVLVQQGATEQLVNFLQDEDNSIDVKDKELVARALATISASKDNHQALVSAKAIGVLHKSLRLSESVGASAMIALNNMAKNSRCHELFFKYKVVTPILVLIVDSRDYLSAYAESITWELLKNSNNFFLSNFQDDVTAWLLSFFIKDQYKTKKSIFLAMIMYLVKYPKNERCINDSLFFVKLMHTLNNYNTTFSQDDTDFSLLKGMIYALGVMLMFEPARKLINRSKNLIPLVLDLCKNKKLERSTVLQLFSAFSLPSKPPYLGCLLNQKDALSFILSSYNRGPASKLILENIITHARMPDTVSIVIQELIQNYKCYNINAAGAFKVLDFLAGYDIPLSCKTNIFKFVYYFILNSNLRVKLSAIKILHRAALTRELHVVMRDAGALCFYRALLADEDKNVQNASMQAALSISYNPENHPALCEANAISFLIKIWSLKHQFMQDQIRVFFASLVNVERLENLSNEQLCLKQDEIILQLLLAQQGDVFTNSKSILVDTTDKARWPTMDSHELMQVLGPYCFMAIQQGALTLTEIMEANFERLMILTSPVINALVVENVFTFNDLHLLEGYQLQLLFSNVRCINVIRNRVLTLEDVAHMDPHQFREFICGCRLDREESDTYSERVSVDVTSADVKAAEKRLEKYFSALDYRLPAQTDKDKPLAQVENAPRFGNISYSQIAQDTNSCLQVLGIANCESFVNTLLENSDKDFFLEALSHEILEAILEDGFLVNMIEAKGELHGLCADYIYARTSGAAEQAEALRSELIKKCQNKDICYHYIKGILYYNVFIGLQSVLCYAQAKDIRLHIYSTDTQDGNTLIRTHFYPGTEKSTKEVSLLFNSNNAGHSSRFQEYHGMEKQFSAANQRFFQGEVDVSKSSASSVLGLG